MSKKIYSISTIVIYIKNGLVWCQAPFCYALSLFCGGCFFATKMRNGRHVTMLDPLQSKYGKCLGALFYIPAFAGEVSGKYITLCEKHYCFLAPKQIEG